MTKPEAKLIKPVEKFKPGYLRDRERIAKESMLTHNPSKCAGKKGYVYILVNESMPGLIKIGYTGRNPHTRARELFKGVTGVPEEFKVAYARKTTHYQAVEREAHKQLRTGRNKNYREFFRVSVANATRVIDAIADWYDLKQSTSVIVVECLLCRTKNRYDFDKANGRRAKCAKCGAWLVFEGDDSSID